MPYQSLNLEEAADYLHLTRVQLDHLVRARRIPYAGVPARPTFRRSELDRWAQCRILGLDEDNLRTYHRAATLTQSDLSPDHALIPDLCRPAWCVPALQARTMPSLLREMAERAYETERVTSREDLQASLEARERQGTTALPGGFALLHPEHQDPYICSESLLLVAHTVQPLPFHAPDGQTTDVFFLLCCQDDRSHLHVLARVCLMCQQTPLIFNLRVAESAEMMYEALLAAEQMVLQPLAGEESVGRAPGLAGS